MAMSSYKNYQRTQRVLNVEQNAAMGMQFSDAPLAQGFAKVLANFEFKDNGLVLVPRGGFHPLANSTRTLPQLPHYGQILPKRVHHVGRAAVSLGEMEDESKRYALILDDVPFSQSPYFPYSGATVLLEVNTNNFTQAENDSDRPTHTYLDEAEGGAETLEGEYLLKAINIEEPWLLHGMTVQDMKKLPLVAHLNNQPYFPAFYNNLSTLESCLSTLKFSRANTEASYVADLGAVTPRTVMPTEAINYGYNMLSQNPYAFQDQLSAAVGANYIILDGVLPYTGEDCTQVMFNAKVGSWITFRLFGRFPDTVSAYKLKWEIRDLLSDDITMYEDRMHTYHYNDGPAYMCAVDENNQRFMRLTFQPPYKQFAVTVTAYSTTDLSEPIQVMSLGSYSLTADALGSTQSIQVKNYDLTSAQGMTSWAQRLVLWGVNGARNMIFLSDINDPSYFPYPNQTDIFQEDVVGCVPFLGDLLVFTETQLIRLVWKDDGISFSRSTIQDKLSLAPYDFNTIRVVKNMVFFKSGNYFYMVVPSANKTGGELQLAPISRPITNLLDNFEASITDILLTMYNPQRIQNPVAGEEFKLSLRSFENFLDGAIIRNVYKFDLLLTTQRVLTVDLFLNYDTVIRAWSMFFVETNAAPLVPYRQTTTDTAVYLNVVNALVDQQYAATVELVKQNILDPRDTFSLELALLAEGRRIKNWQYMDTGFRSMDTDHKKRFREIQFKLNNTSQATLQFGTEFMLDDQTRKDLFKYEVTQDVDPGSPEYGRIYISREYADPVLALGATILGEDDDEPPYPPGTTLSSGDVLYSNTWVLGYSKLSSVSLAKIRFPVSGKGYTPRMKLLSFNEKPFDYLGHGWVFRGMNAR